MSFLVRPTIDVAPLLPLVAGVAVCEALARLVGVGPTEGPAGLKWPNDVLAPALGERKLAGILAESAASVGRAPGEPADRNRLAVVVGTGVNLRWRRQPPAEISDRSATVEELLAGPVDRDELLDLYLRHVDGWLRRIESEGSEVLLDRYRTHCLTLGREVTFTTASAEHRGTAVAVTAAGTLVLETADGPVELHSGDAHHRRAS